MRRLWGSPEVVLLFCLAAACAVAPALTEPGPARAPLLKSPVGLDLGAIFSPPSSEHWLGTDSFGRDLLSRVLAGGRTTLGVAALGAFLAVLIGSFLGLAAGLAGGWADLWIGRLMEAANCFPTLIVALALAASGRLRGALALALVVGLTRWVDVAWLARAEAARWRSTSRIETARASGASTLRLLGRHLLPTAFPLLAMGGALVAAEAVVVEAGAGIVGFGIEPAHPSWGSLLLEARLSVDQAWWAALFPGLAVFTAVAGFLALVERAGGHTAQVGRAAPGSAARGGR